jgi:predicted nuclease of predicted toxin-antitoxin system
MRFLADENVPVGVVEELIAAAHDVQWVVWLAPGLLDSEVLRRAAMEGRILLTFDKDYGDLAHRSETAIMPAGIVLIRSPVPRTREACRDLARVIAGRGDWAGHFSVIEPSRIRRRELRSD